MADFTALLLFGSGFAALMLACVQFFLSDRKPRNRVAGAMFLCLCLLQWHLAALISGFMPKVIHIFRIHIPILFLVGPLAYFYFLEMLAKHRSGKRNLLHFLPALLATAIMFPFYSQNTAAKTASYNKLAFDKQAEGIDTLVFVGSFFILGYLLNTFYRTRYFWNRESMQGLNAKLIFGLLLMSGLSTMSALTVIVTRDVASLYVSGFFLSATTIAISLGSHIFPAFFMEVRLTAQKEKYKRSVIDNLDVAQVTADLERLLIDEKQYLREDISLKNLAAELGVGSHQLSQILNEHLEKNFHTLVNELRIDEARRLLLRHPDQTILSIAYQVGFNSKSSFNTAFQKFCGVTPSAFRTKHQPGMRS